jgi:hypothetical protein
MRDMRDDPGYTDLQGLYRKHGGRAEFCWLMYEIRNAAEIHGMLRLMPG